ncbi:GNAT family N-acetyltransferase [Alkalicoccobacillus gibsonii]|uniref:GNAT family N-acetyltransferase n=1 Tax=Alkalicoccobacillus gibsonii TaxID=79881 RepID=A0ABU9VDA8_9BACI
MAIQRLTDKEFEQAVLLSCFAFQMSDSEELRTRAKKGWEQSVTYGEVTDNGELLAKLEVIPFHVNVFGTTMKMGGIAGVASYPEQRRRGLIKQLITHSLKEMRQEGQILSYLAPFAVGFYRKFGWEIAFNEVTYTFEPSQFPKSDPTIEGQMQRAPFTDQRIRHVYNENASHGMLVRNDSWWERLEHRYSGTQTALFTNEAGDPVAYIVYKVQGRHFETEELVYKDSDGLKALLSFIGQHDSMIKSAEITTTASEHLDYFLPDPKTKAESVPYFMARIVDVEAFLKEFPFAKSSDMSFTLQIEDTYAEWNNQTFAVSIKEGQGSCGVSSEEPTISMSIQTLTSLMLGYRRPSFYLKQGLIKGDHEAIKRFVSLIPGDEPALIDFF